MSVSVAQPERNTKPAAATRRFSVRRAFMPYCERIDIAAITGGPALASKRADIVLPATTPLERNDLGGGESILVAMQQALPTQGDARDEYEIFSDLADRLEAPLAGSFRRFHHERGGTHA